MNASLKQIGFAKMAVCLVACLGLLACDRKHLPAAHGKLEPAVDQVFYELKIGQLRGPETPDDTVVGGGDFQLPSGKVVRRDELRLQSRPLERMGVDAIPYLFKWVRDENLAVRYVAVYALTRVTGIDPQLGDYDPDRTGAKREAAIKVWQSWAEVVRRTDIKTSFWSKPKG